MKTIIREKSHLVRDADDLEFLEQIVQEISLQEFRTEMWKSTKGEIFGGIFGILFQAESESWTLWPTTMKTIGLWRLTAPTFRLTKSFRQKWNKLTEI